MRILIAGLWAATQPSGICRTIVNLIRGLNQASPEVRITLAIGAWQRNYFENSLGIRPLDVEIVEINIPNTSRSRNRWYLFQLHQLARRSAAEVLHLSFPAPVIRGLVGRPIVTTLHDLYAFDCPENFGFPRVIGNRLTTLRALRASDCIACVSESTFGRFHECFPILANQKAVHISNPLGLSNDYSEKAMPIEGPFFLAVGQHRANKNLELLLGSFQLYRSTWDARVQLVVVGSPGPETSRLHELTEGLGLTDCVRFFSGLHDAELLWLYRNCELFVSLSRHEGFDLPLGEALSHGARVLASDIATHREVGGANCEYVALSAPEDAARTATAFKSALLRDKPRSQDCARTSPLQAAQQYLQLYRSLTAQRTEDLSCPAPSSSAWSKR